jgi:hypothetical protein
VIAVTEGCLDIGVDWTELELEPGGSLSMLIRTFAGWGLFASLGNKLRGTGRQRTGRRA